MVMKGHGDRRMRYVQGIKNKIKKSGWHHMMKRFQFLGENLNLIGHKGRLNYITEVFKFLHENLYLI